MKFYDEALRLIIPGRYHTAPSSPQKYPISRCCPACGSHEFHKTLSSITVAFVYDRQCKQCGTHYAPPPGKIWGAFCILAGLPLCLIFFGYFIHVIAAYLNLAADKTFHPTLSSLLCPLPFGLFGLICIWHGSVAFGFYRTTPVQRESKRRWGRR